MRILSLKEALFMLVVNAGYPFGFVRKHCVNWVSSWTALIGLSNSASGMSCFLPKKLWHDC